MESRRRGSARLAHLLAMAALGVLAGLVLMISPVVHWFYEGYAALLPAVGLVVVGFLGNLLWKQTWLLDHPFVTGSLLMINASIGINAGLAGVTMLARDGALEPLDALGTGLFLGIWGVLVTFPVGPLLGFGMVLLSGRLQGRLGVRDDPTVPDPDAPWP